MKKLLALIALIFLVASSATFAHAETRLRSDTYTTQSGTSVNLAKPTGTTNGDLMLTYVIIQRASGSTITPPAGWTQVCTISGGGVNPQTEWLYKKTAASQAATENWQTSDAANFYQISTYDPQGGTITVDGSQSQCVIAGGAQADFTPSALTTSANWGTVVTFASIRSNPNGSTPNAVVVPTAQNVFLQNTTTGSDVLIPFGSFFNIPTAGSTGTPVYNIAVVTDPFWNVYYAQVALTGANPPVPLFVLRGTNFGAAVVTSTKTCTVPAATTAGDLLTSCASSNSTTVLVCPSGFSTACEDHSLNDIVCCTRIAGSGEGGTTVNFTGFGSSVNAMCVIADFLGPTQINHCEIGTQASSNTATGPAVTPVNGGDLVGSWYFSDSTILPINLIDWYAISTDENAVAMKSTSGFSLNAGTSPVTPPQVKLYDGTTTANWMMASFDIGSPIATATATATATNTATVTTTATATATPTATASSSSTATLTATATATATVEPTPCTATLRQFKRATWTSGSSFTVTPNVPTLANGTDFIWYWSNDASSPITVSSINDGTANVWVSLTHSNTSTSVSDLQGTQTGNVIPGAITITMSGTPSDGAAVYFGEFTGLTSAILTQALLNQTGSSNVLITGNSSGSVAPALVLGQFRQLVTAGFSVATSAPGSDSAVVWSLLDSGVTSGAINAGAVYGTAAQTGTGIYGCQVNSTASSPYNSDLAVLTYNPVCPTPSVTATATSTSTASATPTATATQNACTRPTPVPGSTGSAISIVTGSTDYKGTINTCIIPDVTPPTGAPPWGPVYLPTDGTVGALVDFTIHADNSTPDPTDYTLLVNGVCIPTSQGGSGGCQQPTRGSHYYCTQPGKIDFTWAATDFQPIPGSILCVPPSEVPH